MKILIIGDVVGSPGRSIMKRALPLVFRKHDIDYCIANVENAAGGFGITPEIFREFQQSRLGYAAALGVVIFLLTAVATAAQLLLLRKREA